MKNQDLRDYKLMYLGLTTINHLIQEKSAERIKQHLLGSLKFNSHTSTYYILSAKFFIGNFFANERKHP
jgi:hypothetical protein